MTKEKMSKLFKECPSCGSHVAKGHVCHVIGVLKNIAALRKQLKEKN